MGRFHKLNSIMLSAALLFVTAGAATANPLNPVCPAGTTAVVTPTDITALWNNYYAAHYPTPQAEVFAEVDAKADLCRSWLAPPRNFYQRKYGAINKTCHVYFPRPKLINGVEEFWADANNPATLYLVGCNRPEPNIGTVGPRAVAQPRSGTSLTFRPQ